MSKSIKVNEKSGVHMIPTSRIKSINNIGFIGTENLSIRAMNGILDLLDDRRKFDITVAEKIGSYNQQKYDFIYKIVDFLPDESLPVKKLLLVSTINSIKDEEEQTMIMFRFILETLLEFYLKVLDNEQANILIITELNDYIESLSRKTGIVKSYIEGKISFRLTE